MKVTYFPNTIDKKNSVLILGSFATIHNGHKVLIDNAKKIQKNVSIMIIEREIILPGQHKHDLTSLDVRLQQLANLGISKVFVVKFNDSIRNMDGKDFIDKIVKISCANHIVVGEDFACGSGRNYSSKNIAKDFKATIVKHKKINDTKISSSIIREMVLMGEVDVIKDLSPFPFTISSRVNNDKEFIIDGVRLHTGIYVISVIVNDIQYWGHAHISMDNKNYLSLMKLNIKNSGFDAVISFYKLSRVIVSTTKDKVNKSDLERIEKYFRV